MTRVVLFFSLFLFSLGSVNGQDTCLTRHKLVNYSVSYIRDFKNVFIAPYRFSKKDWLITGGIALAGTGVYLLDQDIRWLRQRNYDSSVNNILHHNFSGWGNGIYTGAGLGLMVGYGLIAKKCKPLNAGLTAGKAFLISQAFVRIPKILLNRSRPYQGLGAANWFQPFSSAGGRSFPSGHTTAAFACASALSNYYKKTWISLSVYTIATGVAFSRVYEDRHWASDVFASAAIGWGIGRLVNIGYNNQFDFQVLGNSVRAVFYLSR